MMTEIELQGPLGKRFGRHWKLDVDSPREALDLIEANSPGMKAWIKQNIEKYANYKIVVTGIDGKSKALDDDSYTTAGCARKITFMPLVRGASGVAKIAVAAVLLVVSYFVPALAPYLVPAALSLAVGGIIEMLSPQAKTSDGTERSDKTSYYFNGPVNTNNQGIPVPLIYGRCLVGSQAISASISIDQELSE